MIIAHRGVSFKLPENSLPAFEVSWELGVDGIEGDFHLTKDGEIEVAFDSINIELPGYLEGWQRVFG